MENIKEKTEEKLDKKNIQEELARLEQEYQSGVQQLQSLQANLLRVDGAMKTLRFLLNPKEVSKN